MNAKPTERTAAELHCPRCSSALPEEFERCDGCGYTLVGVKLYKPTHFLWLALLFSGLVPITLAAMNFGRLGQRRAKWRWLGLGFLGFASLFAGLMLFPDVGSGIGKLVGYAINLPIGWAARDRQRDLYRAGLRLGAKPASTVIGTLAGLGVLALAIVLPVVPIMTYIEVQGQRGIEAIQEDRCEEAAEILRAVHRLNSEDELFAYNLGVAEVCLEQWEPAVDHFRQYVRLHDDDPDGHAMLGYCLVNVGREKEAEKAFLRAQAIDPQILDQFEFDPTAELALRPVEGTGDEQRCLEQLRVLLDAPIEDGPAEWGLALGPGLLQALAEHPFEFGFPARFFGPDGDLYGQLVDEEQLLPALRSDGLRQIVRHGIEGQARCADRDERELLRDVVPWNIFGEPATVLQDDARRLLVQIRDDDDMIWLDLISEYPIETEQARDE